MSLLDAYTEQFCVMEKHHEPDGEGGSVTRWEDGMTFSAAVAHDTTIMAQTAEAQDTASTFTLIVNDGMQLAFPDVIKRLRDGETFQITTNGDDLKTPPTSTLNRKAVKMRKWRLPG